MIQICNTFASRLVVLLFLLDFSAGFAPVPRQPTRVYNTPSEVLERAVASSSPPNTQQGGGVKAIFVFGGGIFATFEVAKQIKKKCERAKDGSRDLNDCGFQVAQTVIAAAMTLGGTAYTIHYQEAPPDPPPRRDVVDESYTVLHMLWDIPEPLSEADDLIEGHTVSIAQSESYTDDNDLEHRFFSIHTRKHETNDTHEGLIYHRPDDGFYAVGMHNVIDESFVLERRDFPPDYVTVRSQAAPKSIFHHLLEPCRRDTTQRPRATKPS